MAVARLVLRWLIGRQRHTKAALNETPGTRPQQKIPKRRDGGDEKASGRPRSFLAIRQKRQHLSDAIPASGVYRLALPGATDECEHGTLSNSRCDSTKTRKGLARRSAGNRRHRRSGVARGQLSDISLSPMEFGERRQALAANER
jgi:hypothetical protein